MTKAKAKKPESDWSLIEADYRAGIKTLRQIASEHDITEGAIRKRAKKEEWSRDLSERIRQQADDLVRKEAVRTEVRNESRVPEKEIVRANADMQAGAIIAHRKDIQRYRNLCQALLAQLEAETGEPELFSQIGELLAAPDDKGMDKLNEAYHKAISLPSRIDGVKKLAETLKTLIALERQAFGIDDRAGAEDPNAPDPKAGNRDLIESARAIAFTLARAAKLVEKK